MLLLLVLVLTFNYTSALREYNVLKTEAFQILLNPQLFNWTYDQHPTTSIDSDNTTSYNQFVYRPTLKGHPDLPSWMHYVFSERQKVGYIYGVPPAHLNTNSGPVHLEVVSLNRRSYTTKVEDLLVQVADRGINTARYEVHLKIDNLNVEDMFDRKRMARLKTLLQTQLLWTSTVKSSTEEDTEDKMYVTFLVAATKLGARRPLDPNEGEGVVLRLGSQTVFSPLLIELQEEVKPLWKLPSCPRDFKRTSVERFFRNAGFTMDWCSFRLIDSSNAALHQSKVSTSGGNSIVTNENQIDRLLMKPWFGADLAKDVPTRGYTQELLLATVLPIFLMLALGSILSVVLCLHHSEFGNNEGTDKNAIQPTYRAILNAARKCSFSEDGNETQTVLSNGAIRKANSSDTNPLNGFCGGSISGDGSPSGTSLTANRSVHCRPKPPPYIRRKVQTDF